jgi:hypothetical protein
MKFQEYDLAATQTIIIAKGKRKENLQMFLAQLPFWVYLRQKNLLRLNAFSSQKILQPSTLDFSSFLAESFA